MLPAGMDPRTPVLVGVGQAVHRPGEPGLPGPVELAAESLRRAGADSGTGDALLRAADVIASVATVSSHYPDLAAMVAAEVGASPKRTWQSAPAGGDAPQRLVNLLSRQIAEGKSDIALICGAETMASLSRAGRTGTDPGWPQQDPAATPDEVIGAQDAPSNEMENGAGLWGPIYVYALMESAMRNRLGLDQEAHLARIGGMWSRFSAVAARNPYAWLPAERTVADLTTTGPDNRMVSSPYPKLLMANLTVDQSAGLILCSAAAADAAGVPRDQWVFPHGGATATETWYLSERNDIAASPAIAAAGRAALSGAGIGIDDIAHIDLYSCFPVAVQVGAEALGLAIDDPARPLTVTGGLTFGGGPGNNYSTHGIATMAEILRRHPGDYGLITALGWYITKHGVGVYSTKPPAEPFRPVEAEVPPARRAIAPGYTGPATVEAYTVQYRKDADGNRAEGVVVSALNPAGARILVRATDSEAIAACTAGDRLGAAIEITAADRFILRSERTA